ATAGEVGVEHAWDRADATLHEQQFLIQLLVIGHHEATDHIGVSTDVLGGGVQHGVGTERQRLLQVGGGEGVVHHELGVGALSCLGYGLDVGDGQCRVGGGLHPDQLGVIADGGLDLIDVGGVHHGGFHTPGDKDGVDEPEGATVGVVAQDDVVARLEQDAEQDVGGRHAGGEGTTVLGTLEGGDGLLQHGDGGVTHTGVFITTAQLIGAVLREGGGGVDRDGDRTIVFVRLVSGVDRGG